jgi:2-polyprenyl-3-methyl-5-hydroxy-6-metoxy-1,4-benzoquinol methylase
VMFDRIKYSNLAAISAQVVAQWPEHEAYIERSLSDRSEKVLGISDKLAASVISLADHTIDNLSDLSASYRFLCQEIILPEELYFRRNLKYRQSSFENADRECYSDPTFMRRYMDGLLVSNILWNNHAHAFASYVNEYLPTVDPGSRHLEVGPGHGFFLHFAAVARGIRDLTGWDVSPTSVESTRHALKVLSPDLAADLQVRDIFDAGVPPEGGEFDSIVMSEILEHLEDPRQALDIISGWLRESGTIWINVPANSPAPDHIFLFEGLEQACELVRSSGLKIVSQAAFPMSGTTLEKAIKHKLTISCVIVACKA